MTSYASSLSFCLQNAGAAAELRDPALLECLTTLPFGRTYIEFEAGAPGRFVPSGPSVDTFEGISFALKALGWSAFEWHAPDDQPDEEAALEAVSILSEGLDRFGPVLIGPLDQKLLATIAPVENEPGRYLAVTGLTADGGFVTSDGSEARQSFLAAWQAGGLEGGRGRYGLRAKFEARETLPVATAIARAVPLIRAKLTIDPKGARYWGEQGPCVYAGADAFRLLARDVSNNSLPNAERERLARRILPFAAAQCQLAAEFFGKAYKPRASANMRYQAELFARIARMLAGDSEESSSEAGATALRLADAEASLPDDLR